MSLELTRPVRLQVDFAAPPGAPPREVASWLEQPDAERGVAAILDAGLFLLQVGYPPGPEKPVARERFLDLLRRAASLHVRVSVIQRGPTLSPSELVRRGVAEVALDLTGAPGFPEDATDRLLCFQREFEGSPGGRLRTGVLWRPARGTMAHLPSLLESAAAARMDFIELPPPPLAYCRSAEAAALVPLPEEFRALAAAMRARKGRRTAELRVHDVLLSALLSSLGGATDGGGGRFEGCQAAGALGYVDPDGTVLPCIALRRPLGKVADLSAPGFWQRPEAAAVRQWVSNLSPECGDCAVLDRCRGGCPGAREAVAGTGRPPDPLCDLFRETGAPRQGLVRGSGRR